MIGQSVSGPQKQTALEVKIILWKEHLSSASGQKDKNLKLCFILFVSFFPKQPRIFYLSWHYRVTLQKVLDSHDDVTKIEKVWRLFDLFVFHAMESYFFLIVRRGGVCVVWEE